MVFLNTSILPHHYVVSFQKATAQIFIVKTSILASDICVCVCCTLNSHSLLVYTTVSYKTLIFPDSRLAREFAKDGEHTYTDKLKRIQCILVDISASILKSSKPEEQVHLSTRHTKDLEEWIEEYSRQLPPLEKHVIPVSLFN